MFLLTKELDNTQLCCPICNLAGTFISKMFFINLWQFLYSFYRNQFPVDCIIHSKSFFPKSLFKRFSVCTLYHIIDDNRSFDYPFGKVVTMTRCKMNFDEYKPSRDFVEVNEKFQSLTPTVENQKIQSYSRFSRRNDVQSPVLLSHFF